MIFNGTHRRHYLNADGYTVVSLKTDGGWRGVSLARLIGVAFIPNPNHLPEINHKDYNRQNYSVENLEWISHADNVRYSNCNRPDVSGDKNPNFGNKKLSTIYAKDKSLSKEKQSRPGIQNGRCQPIELYYDNKLVQKFDWMIPCLEYIINKGWSNAKVETLRTQVNKCIKKNRPYNKHLTFKKL